MNDDVLAALIAREAGALLRGIQKEAATHEIGTIELKNHGDRESQAYLSRMLAEQRPQDHVLSEEAPDSPSRLSAERVWIIDPLDGTREFSEGRKDWAVHVALWEQGHLKVGAVALPGLNLVLSSSMSYAAWDQPEGFRLAVSRTRASPVVRSLAADLRADVVPLGSAGFKVGAVVRGEVDAYIHAGGQYEWDSAAPVAVARAAGLFASRIDGSRLTYNQENPYLPDVVICNPYIADDVLSGVASIMGREAS